MASLHVVSTTGASNLRNRTRAGFTLMELLVVIAIISILASLLLPAIARAKQKAQGIACLNNHRQLALAWLMHAHDNEDRFAYAGPNLTQPDPESLWMDGILDFQPGNRSNWDVTRDIEKSPLWSYCGRSYGIFKCPADRSSVVPSDGPFAGRRTPRVRSMTLSTWMGGLGGVTMPGNVRGFPGLSSPPWRMYRRLDDLIEPGPSMTILFWDQREDTINTGSLAIDMTGWQNEPELTQWNDDMPGSYHGRAGGLSFADGHSEIRRWKDGRTVPPIRPGVARGSFVEKQPRNQDIIWLQERTTRRIP